MARESREWRAEDTGSSSDKTVTVAPDLAVTRGIQDPTGYIIKRSWDYMVEHLLAEEPPEEFVLRTGMELVHDRLLADSEKRKKELI